MSVITNNWTSRILEKGVNPFGSGRRFYFVLRGKGDIKVMIIGPQGTSIVRRSPRVCRIPFKSGQLFSPFLKKNS